MIKMVASDLDGTLLIGGRQTLPEEIFPLVKELKKWESSLWQPAADSMPI